MKHKILAKEPLGNRVFIVIAELFSEDELEIKAIENVENANASQEERELIDNFLGFNLNVGNYSIVDQISQRKSVFTVKIYLN